MRLENYDSLQTSQNNMKGATNAIHDIKRALSENRLLKRKSFAILALPSPLYTAAFILKDLDILAVRVANVFQGIIKLLYDPKKGVKLITLNTTLIMTGLVRLTIMTPLSKTILTLSLIVGIASPKTALQISLASYKLDQATHYVEAKIKGLFEESSHIEEEDEVEEVEEVREEPPVEEEDKVEEVREEPPVEEEDKVEEVEEVREEPPVSPTASVASQAETVTLEDVKQEITKVTQIITTESNHLKTWQERAEATTGRWSNRSKQLKAQRKMKTHKETIARLEAKLQDLEAQHAELVA